MGVLLSLLIAPSLSCVKKDPLYCDEDTPCDDGMRCNLGNHTCEKGPDGGSDSGRSDGPRPTLDGIPDLPEQDQSRSDMASDRGGPAEAGADVTLPDLQPRSKCGDGVISPPNEVCDKNALGGKTCKTQGFYGGTLKCKSDGKAFDTSACHDCGNGYLQQAGARTCGNPQGLEDGLRRRQSFLRDEPDRGALVLGIQQRRPARRRHHQGQEQPHARGHVEALDAGIRRRDAHMRDTNGQDALVLGRDHGQQDTHAGWIKKDLAVRVRR